MLKSMIEAIPAEPAVLDANDEAVGWNRHETRLFRRTMTARSINSRQYHPRKGLDMVERLVGGTEGRHARRGDFLDRREL